MFFRMLYLDIRTIVIASALSALAMACALYATSRSFVGAIPGLRRWSASCVVQSAGWSLLATQGLLPDGVSMVVANLLILGSMALAYQALCEFGGRAPRPLLPALWITTVGLLAAWWTYVDPSLVGRTVAVCVGNSGLFFLCGLTLLRESGPKAFSSAWWTGGAFLLSGAGALVRMLAVVAAAPTGSVFDRPGVGQGLASTAMFIGVVAVPFGFLLMCVERCHAELRRLACQDQLTGSLNRGSIDRRVELEWATATRLDAPLAVILLDVDHFKHINDTYGHPVGDDVLRHVAALIRRQVRAGDSVGRYGGEEFMVVLPDTPLERARQVAERIRCQLETDALLHTDIAVRCTLSGGVAALLGGEQSVGALVARADSALYVAKREGRNRIVAAELVA